MPSHFLGIDIEAKSGVDLRHSSVYKYVEDKDFDILLFGFSIDGGPVEVLDLTDCDTSNFYSKVSRLLVDPDYIKTAFNAEFERVCLQKFCGCHMDPEQWDCTAVLARRAGYPGQLKAVAKAMGLGDDKQKDSAGTALINYFCKPQKKLIKHADGTESYFHTPDDDMERWERFKEYNAQDVVVDQAVRDNLQGVIYPKFEHTLWAYDQRMQERGVKVDYELAESAISVFDQIKDEALTEIQEITCCDNPNSNAQIKGWLTRKIGHEIKSLAKDSIPELMESTSDPDVRRVLELRQSTTLTSIAKYQAMYGYGCADGRVHGILQFYGAGKTGRWAGRGVQLQNLPKNHIAAERPKGSKLTGLELAKMGLTNARDVLKTRDLSFMRMLYDDPADILKQLIRTAFVPENGSRYIVCDFSAIEARVIAWYASEQWRLDTFATHGKIYEASASQMFGVPVESIGKGSDLRARGKISELACFPEDSLILTDKGLVPIQDVTTDMKVWDGENWVMHEGVVFKGYREVITYSGLTATPDHRVYVEGRDDPIPFIAAAETSKSLVRSGSGCAPKDKNLAWNKGKVAVYDIVNAGPNHRLTVDGCLVHNCGYGGGVGALMRMSGNKGVPLPEDFEPDAPEEDRMDDYLAHLVKEWRKASPNIVKFWWDVDRMVKQTIKTGEPRKLHHGLGSFIRDGRLNLSLPSGRCLSYVSPSIGKNKFGGESIAHMGVDSTHPNWSKLETYGPKLVENIVQATARDCLAVSMLRLEAEGYDVVFHVHDECIIEKKIGEGSLEEVQEIMGRPIAWAPGLLLRADGYECDFYMKD